MDKGTIYTSRLLPTKEITQLLSQAQETSGLIYLKDTSDLESCAINIEQEHEQKQLQEEITNSSYLISKLNKVEELINQQILEQQTSETGLTANFKRQLSLESQSKTTQENPKLPKLDQEYQTEPMQIDYN